VTAASLRAAVDEVAGSAEMAARLSSLSTEIRAHGGIPAAADAVEAFLK
jgi:UDP:flavonoid glycosyltransferase YjiC (YdhE family)